jgi:hypothetical protein
MNTEFREVTAFRGERIVELCLTDYRDFPEPLFRPGFLGDKWPAIDFYVEVTNVPETQPYFFAQAKATTGELRKGSRTVAISVRREDVVRLLRIPGPTYLFGVHEPSRRVFVRSVHGRTPGKAITRIPIEYELTSRNLQILRDEVCRYWSATLHKPLESAFA